MTVIYLRPEVVAERLGVTVATLANWRATGQGPKHARVSARCVRYVESVLDAWMLDRQVQSTLDPGHPRAA